MSYTSETALYRKAISELTALGYRSMLPIVLKAENRVKSHLRKALKQLEIHGKTKAILTTDQNWALATKLIADIEDSLDMRFVAPGRDVITEIKDRAYKVGYAYQNTLIRGGRISDAMILQGIDATTLKLIAEENFALMKGISSDMVKYLRREITESIIHNRSWTTMMNNVIRDGRVPALVVTDKNGVKRYIEAEWRVDMTVQSETSRIAEQGSLDKAVEHYGEEELWGQWDTIRDGRERESHLRRDNITRPINDWKTKPGPDGKVIWPGQEVLCRCSMRYGRKEDFEAREKILTQKEPMPPKPKPKTKPKTLRKGGS